MDSLSAFLNMGGYAEFVWPSFGLTFVLMVALWGLSRRTLRKAEATLATLQTQAKGRRRPGGDGDAA